MYKKLSKKPKEFKMFVGLTIEEFNKVYAKVEINYKSMEEKRLTRHDRKRAIGAGGQFNLDARERTLMALMYYRCYMTQNMLGYMFDVDSSVVCRNIQKIAPIIRESVPTPKKVYEDLKKQINNHEDLKKIFPELLVIIDATEYPIPRPKSKSSDKKRTNHYNRIKRKTHYSHKKKGHTVKEQITINYPGIIIHKTSHSPGSNHDYKIYKGKHITLPDELDRYCDLGYVGIIKDYPDKKFILPYKKKKGKKLTAEQKEYNKKVGSIRVKVEHAIGKIKKFRILDHVFRNKLRMHDMVTDIICGLVNIIVMRNKEFVS